MSCQDSPTYKLSEVNSLIDQSNDKTSSALDLKENRKAVIIKSKREHLEMQKSILAAMTLIAETRAIRPR